MYGETHIHERVRDTPAPMHKRFCDRKKSRYIWHLEPSGGFRCHLQDNKKSKYSVSRSLPCPIDRPYKVILGNNSYYRQVQQFRIF